MVISTAASGPRVSRTSMMLRIPVPNAPPDLAEKVETALLGQVSEIADQVCNGVLVTSAAAPLENRDRLGSPNAARLQRTSTRPARREAFEG